MDEIDELLTRGVDDILPSRKKLEDILRSGKKLKIYQGFDPSTPKLHIGHMVGLLKLADWQRLGHKVIFLIGDFTTLIGDPTGRKETRPLLSKEAIGENAKAYKQQAAKILKFEDKNPATIKFNSQWLSKLSYEDIINLTSQVSYQQVIKRDLYKKRIQRDEDVSINEIMYPIFQGYDSVVMEIDVEVGGRDQLFNMMMGRDLMHKMKQKNKFVMTTKLLTNPQGDKLGKTAGNTVNFSDSANKIFSSVMNFPDEMIVKGFEQLTRIQYEKIQIIKKEIADGNNPLELKKNLAFELTKQLSNEKEAIIAKKQFTETIQKGKTPQKIEKQTKTDSLLIDAITELVESKSQAKRLLANNAIEVDGKVNEDSKYKLKKGQIIKIGKKIFVKVI